MQSEEINRPRQQSPRGKQARALTRAMDMVSDEFIENFSQTGVDNGPERASHAAGLSAELHAKQVTEVQEAREHREAKEEKDSSSAKVKFVGFAPLLAKAKENSRESAFSRLLDDSDANDNGKVNGVAANNDIVRNSGVTDNTNQSTVTSFKPGTETTLDGSVIRVKNAGKKKRGLYTSCMQKPSISQIETASLAVQQGPMTESKEVEVGILKPSAAQIEAAISQAAQASTAKAVALEQEKAAAQENSCCPLIKNAFGQIAGLWRKLTSWLRTKAS